MAHYRAALACAATNFFWHKSRYAYRYNAYHAAQLLSLCVTDRSASLPIRQSANISWLMKRSYSHAYYGSSVPSLDTGVIERRSSSVSPVDVDGKGNHASLRSVRWNEERDSIQRTLDTLLVELRSSAPPVSSSVSSPAPAAAAAAPVVSTEHSTRDKASEVCRSYLALPSLLVQSTAMPTHTHLQTSRSVRVERNARQAVLVHLATQCGPAPCKLSTAVEAFQNFQNQASSPLAESSLRMSSSSSSHPNHNPKLSIDLVKRLRAACTPHYETVLRAIFAEAEQDLGMRFLVQLRQDLRTHLRNVEFDRPKNQNHSQNQTNPENNDHHSQQQQQQQQQQQHVLMLRQIEQDLKSLLSTWFSSGNLELRRITYEHTPAAIIEKIAKKEAVHPFQSLADVRTRLNSNNGRRCFAFFHPSLPDEPLVFVHVALLPHIPAHMSEIDQFASSDGTNRKRNQNPEVATFYSITSTQPGLSGVDLGHFLIQRVVQVLRVEFPHLQVFTTLSPLPRFRSWLVGKLQMYLKQQQQQQQRQPSSNCATGTTQKDGEWPKFADPTLLSQSEERLLSLAFKCQRGNVKEALLELLETQHGWDNEVLTDALRPVLMRLAARYLLKEKYRGRPLDGVAKFHIRNGAEMYRLNYLADTSRTGLHNSAAGIMVNYRYRLDQMDENHVKYELHGRIVAQLGVTQWLQNDSS